MKTMLILKTFIFVFIVTFAANVGVSYLWGSFFPSSQWQWNTTSTTAVVVGLIVTAFLHRKDTCDNGSTAEKDEHKEIGNKTERN